MRAKIIGLTLALLASHAAALEIEVLRSSDAVPPEIAGRFREPTGFQQSASGQYFVFDRRAHAVFGIDPSQTSSWKIVEIGPEKGRIIEPTAFSVAPDGTFVVADAPEGRERIQVFTPAGFRITGFSLPGPARRRISIDNFVLNGISTLHYTGRSILISQPDSGGIITEYRMAEGRDRTFGSLRPTGHDQDRELHLALNSGLPLAAPDGGFYFVFQAGVPVFRKYDDQGRLVFERHIEGVELDAFVNGLPTVWPRRRSEAGELPFVRPTVRAAALDGDGNLWVSLAVPYTYVYDGDGDKIRTVQFHGAGAISARSLSFGANGRLLVTPGLYEFETRPADPHGGTGSLNAH